MKQFLLSFAMSLTLSVSASAAIGDQFEIDGLKYTVTSEESHTVELNKYTGDLTVTDVDIPQTVTNDEQTYTVTAIGWRAFFTKRRNSLSTISIPNSVTIIGGYAFQYCKSLTSITIPNSVSIVGEQAFEGCENLTEINVECDNQAYSSEDGVLFNKEKTHLIKYPEGKQGAYSIPNSVTNINRRAFWMCGPLTEISIPCSVVMIDNYAFWGGQTLSEINVSPDNQVYSSEDGVLFDKDKTTIIFYPPNKQGDVYKIPASVYIIGIGAFSNNLRLKQVSVPGSVTTIGYEAFSGCLSLEKIIIPNSVTNIGGAAFQYCWSLTTITIPYSISRIEEAPFRGCDMLTTIYMMPTVPPEIDDWCYATTVYVPKGCVEAYRTAYNLYPDETQVLEMNGLYVIINESLKIGVGETTTPLPNVVSDGVVTLVSSTWESSNTNVATVDENGVVTAIAVGSATITYTANGSNGETYAASCEVTVSGQSGIEAIEGDDAPAEFYNLRGIRVSADALTPGIYIRRQGDKATKIHVR